MNYDKSTRVRVLVDYNGGKSTNTPVSVYDQGSKQFLKDLQK